MQNEDHNRNEGLITSPVISDLDLGFPEHKIKLEEGSRDHLVDSSPCSSEASTEAEGRKSENDTNHQHNEDSESPTKEEEDNSNLVTSPFPFHSKTKQENKSPPQGRIHTLRSIQPPKLALPSKMDSHHPRLPHLLHNRRVLLLRRPRCPHPQRRLPSHTNPSIRHLRYLWIRLRNRFNSIWTIK